MLSLPCLHMARMVSRFPLMDCQRCSKLGMLFLTELCFKPLHNYLPDLPAVFLGLHDVVSSLMFPDKPLRPSQNSCIYPESKLHSGGLLKLVGGWLILFWGIRVGGP
ncbi:hypothetical protein CHARACLAT_007254 [Characodon lateralis]|uniref:Uncharacterized protein n=1 Tax=Characodon lateralis TaxID=208331 RepID=A0ABU7DQR3_9TELE|nr:hypothetical protein [Characodon lateralis]